MNTKTLLAATAATVLCATGAFANTLTINDVSGVWQNAVADPLGGTISGAGSNEISWGIPATNQGQSGYVFNGSFPPVATVTEGTAFTLGVFTHNNFPIRAPSLDSVDLDVDIDIGGASPITTVFSFDHFETPNDAVPCPGGDTGECGDIVTATLNLGMSETFEIGGVEYVFNVLGFSTDGGTTLLDSFLTAEGQANSAELIGTFQTRDSVNVVPLPAGAWMLLAGLGGLAMMRRRQNTAA